MKNEKCFIHNEAISELELTELIFDNNTSYGEFALGYDYDAGDSPAGPLYLLVKFDKQFQATRGYL